MKRLFILGILIAGVLLSCGTAHAQRVNVIFFNGNTVAAKVTDAQAFGCATDTNVTCVLYIPPEMSVFTVGTITVTRANTFIDNQAKGLGLASGTIRPVFSVLDTIFGGQGTARCVIDAVTNSTTTVTSATAKFQTGIPPAQVGWMAWASLPNGAGNDGSCNDTINASMAPAVLACGSAVVAFRTTIAAINSDTSITLSSTCTTTGSGRTLYFGPNDFGAISAACTAIPVTGGAVYMPIGKYVSDNSAVGNNPTCSIPATVIGSAEFFGEGQGMSEIFIPPWYNHGFNVGSVIANYAFPVGYVHDFTINLGGIATNQGPDTIVDVQNPAIERISILGANLTNGSTENIYFAGGTADRGEHISDVTIIGLYNAGIAVSGPYRVSYRNNYVRTTGPPLLWTSGAGNSDTTIEGGTYWRSGTAQQGTDLWLMPDSGTPTGIRAQVFGTTFCAVTNAAANAINVNGATFTVRLTDVKINDSGGGCQASVGTNLTPLKITAGEVTMSKSVLVATGTGFSINNAGTLFDAGANRLSGGAGAYTGAGVVSSFNTISNCSSSAAPAVCAGATVGSVVVAAAATTVVVNTTAVNSTSLIFVHFDSSLGAKLSVTCNVTEPALYGVTARSAGVSFTITSSAPVTNPACFNYLIVN